MKKDGNAFGFVGIERTPAAQAAFERRIGRIVAEEPPEGTESTPEEPQGEEQ